MTILIDQPVLFESQVEGKNVHAVETNELVLDGGFPVPKNESKDGFMAPEINSFGHTFRDYDAESERQKGVEEFYRLQHINQTFDFVKRMREEYGKLDKAEMSIWECCELLNEVVDDSDPDLDEPQIQHLLQSAEAIRKDYPDEDWLHLTALIHDLGKILVLPSFGELPQWAVVGDTFPVGCAFDESNIHHKYFVDNPDYKCPAYNTKNGIYTEGCGLDNLAMSWGHDDYMYMVAKENGSTLPSAGLFVIRYHSFYPLHKENAYTHLMNEEDIENLKWLKIFNKYDLYSKSKVLVDVEKVKPYYLSLIEKAFFFSVKNKMVILNDQPVLGSQLEANNVSKNEAEDGFMAPDINSYGHSFRDYDAESERQKGVEEFYRLQHINQTYDFAKRMREKYVTLDKAEMGIWECCELLNDVVDDSDPDLDEPQIQHLLQSAEAIRKDYPDQDWLHLTALIHDLGKILLLPSFGELPQWAVVGDTFPVGCAFDESNIHHQYFKNNPDYECPAYKTKNGIYTEGCGLDNVLMSWGHDEYMYLVAKENGSTLPSAGLFIIRFHSFYPLHKEGAYTHLMNEEDVENLKWLKVFNKYDLYSKSKVLIDVEKVKPYYMSLIEKYFPAKLRW